MCPPVTYTGVSKGILILYPIYPQCLEILHKDYAENMREILEHKEGADVWKTIVIIMIILTIILTILIITIFIIATVIISIWKTLSERPTSLLEFLAVRAED